MRESLIMLTFVVGLFGVGSAVLGFIAEAKKLTLDDIRVSRDDCIYPSNPAFALGLCAVPLLLVALITVSVATGFCGCCKPRGGFSSSRWRSIVGIICSVLTWIAAVLAVLFFLLGATVNAPRARHTAPKCGYPKNGIFRLAAVLSLVATELGIASCVMLRAGTAGEHKPYYGQQPQAGVSSA